MFPFLDAIVRDQALMDSASILVPPAPFGHKIGSRVSEVDETGTSGRPCRSTKLHASPGSLGQPFASTAATIEARRGIQRPSGL